MAFNLISGKMEKGDWSCGAGDDPDAARAKPPIVKNAVLGFVTGMFAGGCYLYWRDLHEKMQRTRLPENT